MPEIFGFPAKRSMVTGILGTAVSFLVFVALLLTFAGVECERKVLLGLAMCRLDCREPQPRVFLVSEVLNTTHRYFYHNVVLHRCDSTTGCCKERQFCERYSYETVNLTFSVYNESRKKFMPPQVFHFENHTECACQTKDNNIK